MEINGFEAHLLLFLLDEKCGVTWEGKLTKSIYDYPMDDLQSLRDRLFQAHEHPAWERDLDD